MTKVFSITGKYLLLSQRKNCNVVDLKHRWSKELLSHFKIDLKIIGTPAQLDSSSILLGNHVSYLDIPILIRSCPDITFVSKKEVKYWPVIGSAATKMNTIFVERKNSESRAQAKAKIAESLCETSKRLVVFPSGTTSIKPSQRWQKGVFEIAEKHNIRVQPFKLTYEPLRESAYIDDDNFLIHMYKIFKQPKIKVTLEFHGPVNVKVSECEEWKSWCESTSSGLS